MASLFKLGLGFGMPPNGGSTLPAPQTGWTYWILPNGSYVTDRNGAYYLIPVRTP